MARLQSDDWETILTAIAVQTDTAVEDGTLKPPLHILITKINDQILIDMEYVFGTIGKVNHRQISPNVPLNEISFPIFYTVSDSEGHETQGVFSEESVRKFHKLLG
jgi:hypothetical protein